MSSGLPENGLHQMASLIGILFSLCYYPLLFSGLGFTHTLANGWTNCSPMDNPMTYLNVLQVVAWRLAAWGLDPQRGNRQ